MKQIELMISIIALIVLFFIYFNPLKFAFTAVQAISCRILKSIKTIYFYMSDFYEKYSLHGGIKSNGFLSQVLRIFSFSTVVLFSLIFIFYISNQNIFTVQEEILQIIIFLSSAIFIFSVLINFFAYSKFHSKYKKSITIYN